MCCDVRFYCCWCCCCCCCCCCWAMLGIMFKPAHTFQAFFPLLGDPFVLSWPGCAMLCPDISPMNSMNWFNMYMLEQMLIITYYINFWTIGCIFTWFHLPFGRLFLLLMRIFVSFGWFFCMSWFSQWRSDVLTNDITKSETHNTEMVTWQPRVDGGSSQGWCTRFFLLDEELKNTRILKIPG